MNRTTQSTQQPDTVPPTLRDGQPRAWRGDDYLTTLARTAFITDNEDLRQLACVLVQWSNRRAANRIARCALELGELLQ